MENKRLSVVVPVYNASRTLEQCLKSILIQLDESCELIVVDDHSSDDSNEIAERLGVSVIRNSRSKGPSGARNCGRVNASGEVILFVDSDIVIPEGALEKTLLAFEDDAVCAVTSLLNASDTGVGLFSYFKNCYMNYHFSKKSGDVSFLYGSYCAVRSRSDLLWDESLRRGEDTELGQRISCRGERILFLKSFDVTHLKEYSFGSLLKNDFLIPFSFASSFLRHRGVKQVAGRRGFSHVSVEQLLSIFVVGLTILFTLISSYFVWAFLALWFFINIKFFIFLTPHFGMRMLLITPFVFLDQFIMGSGILFGLIFSLFSSRER